MRFLADMGVSQTAVAQLQREGHDALHLLDVGLERLADAAILEKGRAESRIVLTFDLDFGDLLAAGGQDGPSVVIFRTRDARAKSVLQRLRLVLAEAATDLAAGAIVIVENQRFRVRRLPVI